MTKEQLKHLFPPLMEIRKIDNGYEFRDPVAVEKYTRYIKQKNKESLVRQPENITTSATPLEIIQAGDYIWVSHTSAAVLTKFDVNLNTILSTVTTASAVKGMAYDGKYILYDQQRQVSPKESAQLQALVMRSQNPAQAPLLGGLLGVAGLLGGLGRHVGEQRFKCPYCGMRH